MHKILPYSSCKSLPTQDAAAAGDVEQFRQEIKQCFEGVDSSKAACREKAASCEPFSHCYGEGPVPTEPRLATWYHTIKHIRRETSTVGRSTMRRMFECMGAPAAAS
uniref:Uncharacterized protein n=1 Tax=Romanomermis culicivorax TaxID=13658 RepID=A0A915J2K5_ROMCU